MDLFKKKIIFYVIKEKRNNYFPNKKKYVCSFRNCKKLFLTKSILLAHLRTHYKIKPYICNHCSKLFNEKGNLKTHIRVHTGERPFKCKICQKSFKASGQLKEHIISHTGLKTFQCPYCNKKYKRKGILKDHFKSHKKEPFFIKNKEKLEEMINKINGMKNKIFSTKHNILEKSEHIGEKNDCIFFSNSKYNSEIFSCNNFDFEYTNEDTMINDIITTNLNQYNEFSFHELNGFNEKEINIPSYLQNIL